MAKILEQKNTEQQLLPLRSRKISNTQLSCPSAMPLLYQSFILNDFCRGPLSNSPIFGILQTKFLNLEAHRAEKDNGKMSQKQQSMFLHNFYNFRYLDVQLWINSVSSNSVLL